MNHYNYQGAYKKSVASSYNSTVILIEEDSMYSLIIKEGQKEAVNIVINSATLACLELVIKGTEAKK